MRDVRRHLLFLITLSARFSVKIQEQAATMPDKALFTSTAVVKPEWIDYNGHMNMGYYLVAFDHIATDSYFDFLDIGITHLQTSNYSTFTLGSNIDFIHEVVADDALRFTTQLVDYDSKRLHYFHTMYHADEGYIAATNECLTMYIDMGTRRGTGFSELQLQRFKEQLDLGENLGVPAGFGRNLGIRR